MTIVFGKSLRHYIRITIVLYKSTFQAYKYKAVLEVFTYYQYHRHYTVFDKSVPQISYIAW